MKLFMTERPSAMAAVCFPVPAVQAAHASVTNVVGHPSVPGTPSVLLLSRQESVTRQESAIGTAQRIRIQGRVLTDVKGINGLTGELDMADKYVTRSGAVQVQVSGVPPRGRPV